MIAQISMQNFIKFQSLQVNTRNVFFGILKYFYQWALEQCGHLDGELKLHHLFDYLEQYFGSVYDIDLLKLAPGAHSDILCSWTRLFFFFCFLF